jgi:hypothetical protein
MIKAKGHTYLIIPVPGSWELPVLPIRIFLHDIPTVLHISPVGVTAAQVLYFRAAVISSTEMEVKTTSLAKLLDKTIWNPRPEIDLAPRAVSVLR